MRIGPDCWEWTAAQFSNGYGQFRQGLAHRWAYQIYYGSIPEGMLVMHGCDNRLCVRPAHLGVGTHADNMNDMKAKGRQRRGGGRPRLERCGQGHDEWYEYGSRRYCRPCQRRRAKDWRERQSA